MTDLILQYNIMKTTSPFSFQLLCCIYLQGELHIKISRFSSLSGLESSRISSAHDCKRGGEHRKVIGLTVCIACCSLIVTACLPVTVSCSRMIGLYCNEIYAVLRTLKDENTGKNTYILMVVSSGSIKYIVLWRNVHNKSCETVK
jgi:hypothetical protein